MRQSTRCGQTNDLAIRKTPTVTVVGGSGGNSHTLVLSHIKEMDDFFYFKLTSENSKHRN